MKIEVKPEQAVQEASDFSSNLAIVNVQDQETLDLAGETKNNARKFLNQLEEKRKAITKPLDDAKKEVMNLFKPMTEKINQFITSQKIEIQTYLDAEEKKRRIAEQKLFEEQERKRKELLKRKEKAKKPETVERLEEEIEVTTNVMPIIPTTKSNTSHTRTVWRFKIVDFSKIPDEYKLANESAIRNKGRDTKGKGKIPGVKFYSEKVVV